MQSVPTTCSEGQNSPDFLHVMREKKFSTWISELSMGILKVNCMNC